MGHVAVLALLVASVTQAQEEAATTPTTSLRQSPGASAQAPPVPAESQPSPERRGLFHEGPHLGLQGEVGAPGGATLALVGRPWHFLRANAGLAWNYFGFGVKGGLTLVPF